MDVWECSKGHSNVACPVREIPRWKLSRARQRSVSPVGYSLPCFACWSRWVGQLCGGGRTISLVGGLVCATLLDGRSCRDRLAVKGRFVSWSLKCWTISFVLKCLWCVFLSLHSFLSLVFFLLLCAGKLRKKRVKTFSRPSFCIPRGVDCRGYPRREDGECSKGHSNVACPVREIPRCILSCARKR